nr:MAG TPA: hypothetical protein [Caudoviricetes sp.]
MIFFRSYFFIFVSSVQLGPFTVFIIHALRVIVNAFLKILYALRANS